MTTATLPRLPTSPVGHRIASARRGRRRRHHGRPRRSPERYERLSRLSNAELARLGLTRQDIPRAAVNGIAGF